MEHKAGVIMFKLMGDYRGGELCKQTNDVMNRRNEARIL